MRECGGRRLRAVSSALALAALIGCEEGPEPPISRAEFVEANVALRMVPDTAPEADSLRAAALDSAGVAAEELNAWLAATRDPEVLADTWREIGDSLLARRQRADAPAPLPDTAAGGGGPDTVPRTRSAPGPAGAERPSPPGSLREAPPPSRPDKAAVGDKRLPGAPPGV